MEWRWAWCCVAVALCLCADGTGAQTSPSGLYQRRPIQPPLPEDHPRLARRAAGNSHAPEQVHLAFAGTGAYAVTWVTYPLDDRLVAAAVAAEQADPASRRLAAAAAPQLHLGAAAEAQQAVGRRRRNRCSPVVRGAARSVVQYGTEPGSYDTTVESPEPAACYSSAQYVSGAIHRVVFGAGVEGPLPPSTTVYYRVGDPARGWSAEFAFKTAPLTGGAVAFPYRLGLVGDLGQTDHSLSTLEHLNVSAPDSVILTGDLSYADGYQPRWDTWGRLVAPATSTTAWMYCVGNHEIELTNGAKDFLSYETRFFSPYRHSLSTSKLYYSYDVAGAHVIMLGSYAPYGRRSEQYAWLVRDLAGVDRGRTPWVIVVMHAPWYNSNYAHQGEGEPMREAMEALLYEHGVDFVFAGHVHAYERHHRVYDEELDHCAPIHINIGDGGNKEGPDKKYYDQPSYSAFREPSFGHGTLDLIDGARAEWRWHRNQDDGPESADSVSVVRDPDCKSRRAARLAAHAAAARQRQQQQQGQQQGQPRMSMEDEAEEQALLLEQEARRRVVTHEQREQFAEEEAAQGRPCPWHRACAWVRRWARLAAQRLLWLA